DFFLTFPTEVRSIWSSQLTGTSVVFILSRYSFLLSKVMQLYVLPLPARMTDTSCRNIHNAATAIITISGSTMEVLSVLRVYALFGQRRSLLILLCPFIIARMIIFLLVCPLCTASLRYIFRHSM
ncbi:hypothetical protein BDP27DRAFT_1238418, partial [Rhodocollybia butyracea]